MRADAVLTEQIAAAVRADIVEQRLAPGSTVTEGAVARTHDVARPTARLAIDRLVAEGVLRREPHHAARIPVLDPADIRDLYDNRAVVEAHGLARLAGTGAVPSAAVTAHRALAIARHDHAALDIAFHRALMAGQPSPRLLRLHDALMGEVELGIGQVFAADLIAHEQLIADHRAMLDAVVAGDGAAASRAAADHILRTRDALLTHHSAVAAA